MLRTTLNRPRRLDIIHGLLKSETGHLGVEISTYRNTEYTRNFLCRLCKMDIPIAIAHPTPMRAHATMVEVDSAGELGRSSATGRIRYLGSVNDLVLKQAASIPE